MRIMSYLLLMGVLLLNNSCQTAPVEEQVQAAEEPDSLTYSFDVIERNRPCADTAAERCIDIRIESINISEGSTEAVRKKLETYLNQQISATDNSGQQQQRSPAEIAADLVEEYSRIIREMKAYQVPWQYYREFEVYLNQQDLFGVALNTFSFTGGAHPAEFRYYYNFDTENGKLLTLKDLFLPQFYDELRGEAEKEFRTQKNIDSGTSYEEAGYWFENENFVLSENYKYTPGSLILLYNPYEIAAYAEGSTTLELEYSRIRDLLKPEYRISKS